MDLQQAAPTKTGGGDSELREDVPNENPESYCRLCFSETNVHALFPQNGSIIREITEKIRNCAGVQISVREDYPAGICHSCLSILDEINQFQQRSRRCDEIIRTKRSLLEQITVKVEMTEEEGVSFVPPATAGGDDYGNDDCLTESSIIAEAITTLNGMGDLMGSFHHHHHHHLHGTSQPLVQVKADVDGMSGASQKDHRCMVCSKVFPDRETWMMHLGDHSEERPHQCMECLAQFREKRSLARHMKAVHEEVRDRQCPYCPKSFKYSHHLRYHIRTHTGEKPYVCQICSDCFSQHIQWKRHMVKHQHRKPQPPQPLVQTPRAGTEDPPIKCEFCPRVFSRQQDYRRHQPSHNADNLNISSIQQAQHQMQQHLQQLHHNHVPVQQPHGPPLPPHVQQQQQQQHQPPPQQLLQPPEVLHGQE